eukprot:12001834-Alexandrium_andersonii.AAC.1
MFPLHPPPCPTTSRAAGGVERRVAAARRRSLLSSPTYTTLPGAQPSTAALRDGDFTVPYQNCSVP